MNNLKLDPKTDSALSRLQDTYLSPMEEALFQAWAKANSIKKPDAPDDPTDYRGIWKLSGGKVLPWGELKKITQARNDKRTLTQAMLDRMQDAVGTEQDRMDQVHKEQRQDITHQQQMQQKGMEIQKAPYDLQMKDKELVAKDKDLEKQRIATEQAQIGNQGKELDLIKTFIAPPAVGGQSAAGQSTTSSSQA